MCCAPMASSCICSVRWSAPIEIDRLKTADPLDPAVKAWWQAKAAEIYKSIPDFGGFLVKATSEGEPGPQDYHRTHADGANLLADVLKPYNGVVMWRAFVHANDPKLDRATAAHKEFVPLDGQFRDNVVVQVKNGPIDFLPREPFAAVRRHAQDLADAGVADHQGISGPADASGLSGAVVRRDPESRHLFPRPRLDHRAHHRWQLWTSTRISGIAGVANIGNDADWSGSIFNQANWYVFGRMAWDTEISARAVAQEWARQTFTADPAFVNPTVDMVMLSREAVVNYMNPLGLHHLFTRNNHFGPQPWDDAGSVTTGSRSITIAPRETASASTMSPAVLPPSTNRR